MTLANLGARVFFSGVMVVLIGSGAIGQTRSRVPGRPPAKAKAPINDPFGADAITLKDGKTLLGQVYDAPARMGVIVIVRRAWAEAKLPDWAAKWSKLEHDSGGAAVAQRRERIAAWRRDRGAKAGTDDRITPWLDAELAKPVGPGEPSTLMVARLSRGDVKTINRRGKVASRTLRLGWTLGIKDVETMPLNDLKDAVEGRGLLTTGDAPVSLDSLLPPSPETDGQWLLRRAATEVSFDGGTRFLRFGSSIIPEPAPGQAPDAGSAGALLTSTLKDLLGEAQPDPLAARLNQVAGTGHVGALVTRLDLAADMGSVTVDATLYVRAPNGWVRGRSRSGTFQSGDAAPGAVQEVADDPQVKSVFGLVDSLGFGQVSGEMKQKSLMIGATTKRALGIARSALARDIAAVALPVAEPSATPPGPKE